MRSSARWTIWLSYWALLLTLTHLPAQRVVHIPGQWLDEVVHGLLFVLLSLLGCWAVPVLGWRSSIGLILGLVGYAAVDEWTQAWVGRTPDSGDWIADASGVVIGAGAYHASVWLARRNHHLAG